MNKASFKDIVIVYEKGPLKEKRKVKSRRRSVGNPSDLVVKIDWAKYRDQLAENRKRRLSETDIDRDIQDIPEGIVGQQIEEIENYNTSKKPRELENPVMAEMEKEIEGGFTKAQLASLKIVLDGAISPLALNTATLASNVVSLNAKVSTFESSTNLTLSNIQQNVKNNADEIQQIRLNSVTKTEVLDIIKQHTGQNADANKDEVYIKALKYSESRLVVVGLVYPAGDMAEAKTKIDEFIEKMTKHYNVQEKKKEPIHKAMKKSIREVPGATPSRLVFECEGNNKVKARGLVLKTTKYKKESGVPDKVKFMKDLPIYYRDKYWEFLNMRNVLVNDNLINEGFITWQGAEMVLKVKYEANGVPVPTETWKPPTADKSHYMKKDAAARAPKDFSKEKELLSRKAFVLLGDKTKEWIDNTLRSMLAGDFYNEMKDVHENRAKQLSITFTTTELFERFVKEVHGFKFSRGDETHEFKVKTFSGIENKIITQNSAPPREQRVSRGRNPSGNSGVVTQMET